MSTSIQLYTLLEKTSSFFSSFKFATESKKYLGERFDAYLTSTLRFINSYGTEYSIPSQDM